MNNALSAVVCNCLKFDDDYAQLQHLILAAWSTLKKRLIHLGCICILLFASFLLNLLKMSAVDQCELSRRIGCHLPASLARRKPHVDIFNCMAGKPAFLRSRAQPKIYRSFRTQTTRFYKTQHCTVYEYKLI